MFSIELYFLPFFLISSATDTGAQNVITESTGDSVFLPCYSPFNLSDEVYFKWIKSGGQIFCNYRIQNKNISNLNCESRFKVNTDPFGLILPDVKSSDAGVYNCSVSRLIPPPILEDFTAVILQVKVPVALVVKQMNSSNASCIHLLCSLEGLSPEQVNFTWSQESVVVHRHNNSNITIMNSTLRLCKPDWNDGDTFTCQASYSSNHTLYNNSITVNANITESISRLIIVGSSIGACLGLVFIIALSIVCYKRKKKANSTGSIVFTNKIYENFNDLTPRPSFQPSARLNTTTNPRRSPRGTVQSQREECIYEN
ncbi:uncharacterized protein [Hoplias malabaricus]|uniref:uncharacterized protein n=1 Tax=Hoplias malabaricus TaxID=27720 RepID=UPI003461E61F